MRVPPISIWSLQVNHRASNTNFDIMFNNITSLFYLSHTHIDMYIQVYISKLQNTKSQTNTRVNYENIHNICWMNGRAREPITQIICARLICCAYVNCFCRIYKYILKLIIPSFACVVRARVRWCRDRIPASLECFAIK